MEQLNNLIFNYIGDSLKKISKFLFNFCLIVGTVVLFYGVIRFLIGFDECDSFTEAIACTAMDVARYSDYADCFYGKAAIVFSFRIALASLAFLPLYGLGELILQLENLNINTHLIYKFMKQPNSEKTSADSGWICKKCNKDNDQNAQFCRDCGAFRYDG